MATTATTVKTYDPNTGTYGTGYVIDGKTYTNQEGTQRVADGTYVNGADGTLYQYTGGKGVVADLTGETNPFSSNYNGFGTVGFNPKKPTPPASTASSGNEMASTLSDKYINDIYDAQTQAKEAALKSAYDQNVLAANNARAAIPGTYYDARNGAASSAAVGQANFNERAAANGLNSGAGSQAALAMNNTLQSNLSGLDKQQAKDTSAIDLQLSQISAKYQNDIAAAVADGQFQKAQALYNKMVHDQDAARQQSQFDATMNYDKSQNAQTSALQTAQITGIYDGMAAYGWRPDQIAAANAAAKPTKTVTYTTLSPSPIYGGLTDARKEELNNIAFSIYSGNGTMRDPYTTIDNISQYDSQEKEYLKSVIKALMG